MTVVNTNNPVTYNSGSETFHLKATITSPNGTVNEGDVVFTLNGVSSGPIAVSAGMATYNLTLSGNQVLAAGSYPTGIAAVYTDSTTNDFAPATATGRGHAL